MYVHSPGSDTAIPMIHEGFEWPTIPGLTLEHVIALGRTSTPGAFYDMLHAGLNTKESCVFCNPHLLKGEIIYDNDTCFAFIPPGDFNRHKGALAKKFVIVLKRHTANPVLRDGEVLGMNRCRRYLHKKFGCFAEGTGGANYTRWGSTIFNAGTVIGHLHENVDEPNGLDEIRPAVYKNLAGWRKDRERLRGYLIAYKPNMTRDEYIRSHAIHHDGLY
jgi:hypothetical protein